MRSRRPEKKNRKEKRKRRGLFDHRHLLREWEAVQTFGGEWATAFYLAIKSKGGVKGDKESRREIQKPDSTTYEDWGYSRRSPSTQGEKRRETGNSKD